MSPKIHLGDSGGNLNMEQGLSDLQVRLLIWVDAVGDGGYIGNCP